MLSYPCLYPVTELLHAARRPTRSVAAMAALRYPMFSTRPLTTDDLDDMGCSSFNVDQPLALAAELGAAVDQGLIADQADTGYALMVAAEITERAGDLQGAQVLAERSVEAYCAHGAPDDYARAFHARLLLRLGREDEAMAELTAMRPLLSEDVHVVSYLSEALERGGRAEIAEQWLTEALTTALQRQQELASQPEQPAYEQATEVVLGLAQERRRVRGALDLPRDEHDYLADRLGDAALEALGIDIDGLDDEGTVVLFWPQPEFDRLLLRWPALAEEYGHTWDEYLTTVQRSLVLWSESGHPRLTLVAGVVDQLARYAHRISSDPTARQVRQGYAEHLAWHPRQATWSLDGDQECWCGAALKP